MPLPPLRDRYLQRIAAEGLERDPAQLTALEAFQRVIDALSQPQRPAWGRLLRRSPLPAPRGLYLWGGVGRGKTWLMDLFYEQLSAPAKTRLHFHRFMQLVHVELTAAKGRRDPLSWVAGRMAERWRLLCLDEFQVVDIGDAMIIAGLLRGLFGQGVVLVATSNVCPHDLYQDGIQRASFLPAIDLLMRNTEVLQLVGHQDYRRRLLEQARVYHSPLGAATESRLLEEFRRLANGTVEGPGRLLVNAREVAYRLRAGDVAWFDFEALCGPPRSRNDYIELARVHHSVVISDIPILGAGRDDQARRFIFLVDEFYDRRVKLVLSAQVPAARLYLGERLAFEFQRTLSRLEEMQTAAYLARPHIG